MWVTGETEEEASAAYTVGICETCFHSCRSHNEIEIVDPARGGATGAAAECSQGTSRTVATASASLPPAPPPVRSVLGALSRLRTPRFVGRWGSTLVCRGCKGMYHRRCVAVAHRGAAAAEDGCDWFCNVCVRGFSLSRPPCATPGASASHDPHEAFGFPDGPKVSVCAPRAFPPSRSPSLCSLFPCPSFLCSYRRC